MTDTEKLIAAEIAGVEKQFQSGTQYPLIDRHMWVRLMGHITALEGRLDAKDTALEPFRTMLTLAENVARMDNEQIKDGDLFAALNAHGYHAKLTWGDLRALTTPDTGEQSELERLRWENEELRQEARDWQEEARLSALAVNAAEHQAQALRERVEAGLRLANQWEKDAPLMETLDEAGTKEECAARLYSALTGRADQQGAEHHQWSRDGERCVKCGEKAWMAGPFCNGTGKAQQGEGDKG